MTASPGQENAFTLRVGYDQDELLGARWWQEHLRHSSLQRSGNAGSDQEASRRQALKVLVALGGAALFGGVALTTCNRRTSSSGAFRPSLALQRAEGAFVGAPANERLTFPDATLRECDDLMLDRSTLGQLATALRPTDPRLQPWYVPTLFQSLGEPANGTLRDNFQMICSPAMRDAFAQGEAMRELLEHAESPRALAMVVDLPGPEAVAFAAGLQPAGAAVFTFDNWPHPRGVVAAHLTLAAAVYYRTRFTAPDAAGTPATRPTVFVLDRNRLADYVDDAGRFDNRYPAKLPEPNELKDYGVQRVLYVVPAAAAAQELDDLNEKFVRYRGVGIEVRMLSVGDFARGEPAATTPQAVAGTNTTPRYYWHGSPGTHWWFWNHYAWPSRPSGITPQQPMHSSFGATWSPQQRSTNFGTGVARLGQTRDPNASSSSGRSGSSGRSSGYRGSSS